MKTLTKGKVSFLYNDSMVDDMEILNKFGWTMGCRWEFHKNGFVLFKNNNSDGDWILSKNYTELIFKGNELTIDKINELTTPEILETI